MDIVSINYIMSGIIILFFLFLVSIFVIVKLLYDLNSMKYDLEISKINCQKDLNRLEDKINAMMFTRNRHTEHEIEKLEKIQQNLIKIIDGKVSAMDDKIGKKIIKG